ncbi:MAG: hypothetical protein JWM41_2264 [Gemmatimonadetes bacterium]|nr:hypothetical protein [Gemmatimonadota bacterium]
MRILYVAQKYDYGDPARGFSFEHWNFHHSLLNSGHDILYFDFGTLLRRHGRATMNQRLADAAMAEKPDLAFFVLTGEELDRAVVRSISDAGIVTANWFCDDHWRFESFSRHWAPCFHWTITTANSALPRYRAAGIENVLKSQWACNHFLYERRDVALRYDVTFVGQPHGNRPAIIDALRTAGLEVRCWGEGWPLGRLGQDEMIDVFNASRINLNLSNASATPTARRSMVNRMRSVVRAIPGGEQLARAARYSRGALQARAETVSPVVSAAAPGDQIKGRNFEVPGCGGFTLTGGADDLEAYFTPDREIVRFTTLNDVVERATYYLQHDDERAAIARAGYDRTLGEHTYVHRFARLFAETGLAAGAPSLLPRSGTSVDVD